jgi:predicted nucleic acid-binding protein
VIAFVTYGELRKWARIRDWAPHNIAVLSEWLDRTPVIDSDADIATAWGELSAVGAKRGRPRPENDTWIAACSLVYDIPLATLNVKDFQGFVDNHGLKLITL